MTDKMRIELKKEMLQDLAQTYYDNFYESKELDIIEKRISAYDRQLYWFKKYNVETWEEVEKKVEKKLDK